MWTPAMQNHPSLLRYDLKDHLMSFRKHVTPVSAQLVTYETDIPPAEILARLDVHLNRDHADKLRTVLAGAKTRADMEKGINSLIKDCGFIYFSALPHHRWLETYFQRSVPVTVTYTIGNPLIAQTILKHEPRAAAQIPPRLLVLGKEDGSGTSISYYLPSSVMKFDDNPELKEGLEALDAKLERFIVDYVVEGDSRLC